MNYRCWILILILVLALVLLLPACSNPSPATTTPPAVVTTPATTTSSAPKPATAPTQATASAAPIPATVTPKSGGILRIGTAIDAVAIGNPALGGKSDTDSMLTAPVIEQMCKIDEKGNMVPWLLDSYKADYNTLTIMVYAKKGIKFLDGTDFNTDALIYNYQIQIARKLAAVQSIKSLEKVDDYTLKINLKEWDADVEYNVLRAYEVSPTAWLKNGEEWGMQNPVGTGAFKLASRQRDANIKYVKNEDYWQKGKPYLNEIDFIIIKDEATRLAAFKAGEIDISLDPTIAQAQELKNNSKYVIQDDPGVGSYRLGFDGNNPDTPFYKKEVRQAIGYAIDRQALVDGVLGGFGMVATQWFPPGVWAYNPDLKGYPYDPAKAKQLLAQAGYPDGFKTQLIGSSANPFALVLQGIQGMLSKVNITADLNLMAPAALDATYRGGWKNGIAIRQLPPSPFMLTWSSNYVIYSNRSTWVSLLNAPEIDEIAHKANSAPDTQTRQPLAWKLMDLIFYQYAQQIPLFISDALLLKYPYVKGEGLYTVILNGEWHPENGWLDK